MVALRLKLCQAWKRLHMQNDALYNLRSGNTLSVSYEGKYLVYLSEVLVNWLITRTKTSWVSYYKL